MSDNNITTKVEQYLSEKQAGKEFKDTENRVGGTRKEKAAYKMVLKSDLETLELNPELAIDLVKKDKVYPEFDAQAEADKGTSSGAAYLKKKLREYFPSVPVENTAIARKIYVEYADYIYNLTKDAALVEDVLECFNTAIQNTQDFLYKVVNPEFYERHQERKRIHNERINTYKQMLENANKEFSDYYLNTLEKYENTPAVIEGVIQDDKLPPEVSKELGRLVDNKTNILAEKNNYQKDYQKYEPEEIQFIRNLARISPYTYFYDEGVAFLEIFQHYLTNKFYKFLRVQSDSAVKIVEEAKQYQFFSEEQSAEKYAKVIEPIDKDIIEIKQDIYLLKNGEQDEVIHVLKKSNTGYHKSIFGNMFLSKSKWVYVEDILNANPVKIDVPVAIKIYSQRYISSLLNKEEKLVKRKQELVKKYAARVDDWSWSSVKNATRKKSEELRINTGKPLDFIKRIGGLEVTDDDVKIEFLKDKLGFKSITLGNYVKDDEAREHIRHFIGAVADLGEMLNMDLIKLFELNKSSGAGGLSLWFGAGGGGGYAAYYRANGIVINLTKKRGDGAVAHEFAHYLDNALNYIDNPSYSLSDRYGMWGSSVNTERPWKNPTIKNENVLNAMNALMTFIYKGNGSLNVTKINIKLSGGTPMDIMWRKLGEMPKTIEEAFEKIKQYTGRLKYAETLKRGDYSLLRGILKEFGLDEYEFTFMSRSSAYYSASNAMSSDYWTRPWELFARAFETYMYDKLESKGRFNNYLVSGSYFGSDVYPQNEERAIIYKLIDNLMATIKKEYALPDFVSFTQNRVNEYIELQKDGDVKEEIIDVQATDENEYISLINNKLRTVTAMLDADASKFENGGLLNGGLVNSFLSAFMN